MKCLVLTFQNAGLFNPKWSKDKVCDANGVHDRNTFAIIDVPVGTLSLRHISNVLHVLMGERPVASIRATHLKPIKEIFDLARGAHVKIDTVLNGDKYWRETKNVRKSIAGSWNTAAHTIKLRGIDKPIKAVVVTWDKLIIYLGSELFEKFKDFAIRQYGENALKERAEDVISMLSNINNPEKEHIISLCENAAKTPLAHLLRGNTEAAAFNQASDVLIRRTVLKGVETISRIDGKIFIPIDEQSLERISTGPGSATLLEGGVVTIEGVEDMSDDLIFDTKKPVE